MGELKWIGSAGRRYKHVLGEVLDRLSEPERQLLKRVLRIEHENIHLTKPRVADDMLRAVRETIK